MTATKVMGQNFLRDRGKGSPVLVEMGLWECFLCVWAILAVLSLIIVYMARTKNIGKGKAASSFVEQAVKKRKADTSEVVKNSKGKRKNQSSKMRKKVRMRRLRKCLMNLLKPCEQSGPNQLQIEALTVKGA